MEEGKGRDEGRISEVEGAAMEESKEEAWQKGQECEIDRRKNGEDIKSEPMKKCGQNSLRMLFIYLYHFYVSRTSD